MSVTSDDVRRISLALPRAVQDGEHHYKVEGPARCSRGRGRGRGRCASSRGRPASSTELLTAGWRTAAPRKLLAELDAKD